MQHKINPKYETRRIVLLSDDKNSHVFFHAAINGVIDENIVTTKETIVSLKNLFKNRVLSEKAKKDFIPNLLFVEKNNNIRIRNKYEVIKFLVQQEVDGEGVLLLYSKDKLKGDSYQNEDSINVDLTVLKALVDGGVNINVHVCGYSALHAAIISLDHFNWQEKVDYLLGNGCDPNLCETKIGMGTVLHLSLANEMFDDKNSYAKAKYLISKLVGSNYDWNLQDSEGKTALILAAKMRAREILKMLLELKHTHQLLLDVNFCDNEGRTALHFAAALGDDEGVKLLLESGALLTKTDKNNKTALDYANTDEYFAKIILKEMDIDPYRDEYALHNCIISLDAKPVLVSGSKGQAVPIEAKKENIDWLEAFKNHFEEQKFPSEKEKEYDLNFMKMQFNFSGNSLIAACMNGRPRVRRLLLSAQFMSTESVVSNLSGLYSQAPRAFELFLSKVREYIKNQTRHDDLLEKFLVSLNKKEFSLGLRQVCAAGNYDLVLMLIDYLQESFPPHVVKSCIEATSSNGKTALHWAASSLAAKSGDFTIITLLLQHHPKEDIRDQANKLYSDYLPEEKGLAQQFSHLSI